MTHISMPNPLFGARLVDGLIGLKERVSEAARYERDPRLEEVARQAVIRWQQDHGRRLEYPNTARHYRSNPDSYPDVTPIVKAYEDHIIAETRALKEKYGPNQAAAIIAGRFAMGQAWDLKGKHGLPHRDQFARYRGELVTDAYISNHAFGVAMQELGFSEEAALNYAQGFSLLSRRTWDQESDQEAIRSAYAERNTGNPWANGVRRPVDFPETLMTRQERYDAQHPMVDSPLPRNPRATEQA